MVVGAAEPRVVDELWVDCEPWELLSIDSPEEPDEPYAPELEPALRASDAPVPCELDVVWMDVPDWEGLDLRVPEAPDPEVPDLVLEEWVAFEDRRGTACSADWGARRAPAESGSEEIPMCWLVSLLVAHVMPAVSTMPSSAASVHSATWRLIRSTIGRPGLSAGKACLASSIDLGQAECRDGAAAGAVVQRHLTAPLAHQLPCDRQPETAAGWAIAPSAAAMETLEDRLGIVGG